jgi:hypothetical protein
MIGAGSSEPEARLPRRIAAIAAPPTSNVAGQNQPRTCRWPVPIPVRAVETVEPSARLGVARSGFVAGVGRDSLSLVGRTCFEGDVATEPRTCREGWRIRVV